MKEATSMSKGCFSLANLFLLKPSDHLGHSLKTVSIIMEHYIKN